MSCNFKKSIENLIDIYEHLMKADLIKTSEHLIKLLKISSKFNENQEENQMLLTKTK